MLLAVLTGFIIVFSAFFLNLIFSMCALKNIVIFQMRSSCWCCSSGCKKCIVVFCPTSDLGLEKQKRELLFSAIFHRDEKIPVSSMDCPSHQQAQVHASKQPVDNYLFPLSLGCTRSEFSGVML